MITFKALLLEEFDLVQRARDFAQEKHRGHRRKYTGEPYFNHLEEVANLVRNAGMSDEAIAAGYLHDSVEDMEVRIQEIESLFGRHVASLVDDLTDISRPSDGNRKTRKNIDLRHSAKASPEAKSVKHADLISNTKDIVKNDPNFAIVYLKEKEALMGVLTPNVSRKLEQMAWRVLEESKKALGVNATR